MEPLQKHTTSTPLRVYTRLETVWHNPAILKGTRPQVHVGPHQGEAPEVAPHT